MNPQPTASFLRRLERAELDNLRIAVAELARRVDELEAKLADAEAQAFNESLMADMWRDMAEQEGKQVTLVLARDDRPRGAA